MKYLQDYIEEKQTKLFNETGVFFAFSKSQFNKSKKEGKKYVALDGGMFCESDKVKELINGLDDIWKEGIKDDLKENGKEGIIRRELYNHEAFYTWGIEQTFEAVKCYGFTKKDVKDVFLKEAEKVKNDDNF